MYFINTTKTTMQFFVFSHFIVVFFSGEQHEKQNKTWGDLQEEDTEGPTWYSPSLTCSLLRTLPHTCYLRGHSAADVSDSEQQGALTSYKSELNQSLKAPNYRLNNRETPAVTRFLLRLKNQMTADRMKSEIHKQEFLLFSEKKTHIWDVCSTNTWCRNDSALCCMCNTYLWHLFTSKRTKKQTKQKLLSSCFGPDDKNWLKCCKYQRPGTQEVSVLSATYDSSGWDKLTQSSLIV